MRKGNLLIGAMAAVLLLGGCQSNADNSETEALKAQIERLEQQVTELEQRRQSEEAGNVESAGLTGEDTAGKESADKESADKGETTGKETIDANGNAANEASATTYTMQELSDMVDAYVEKAKAASPSGNTSADMEQFFSLKQEEKQIDDRLDVHEDELEYLYRNNSLTRDEYTKMERELELLEDKLDDVEDRLEFTYGIDD